ncbi:MAG: PEP-CTERM sorting domain-containing protein [Candidatus Schekmanbacteria bacterium]|nr:PEP-CTERM sorting domain-containing protein [Candidatus Schekmanbacteria bacterium]
MDGSGCHGFRYDSSNWSSLDYPGASGTRAFGIDGANIMGRDWDDSGEHGFIATPAPEPASMLLLGSGLIGLLGLKKKRQ